MEERLKEENEKLKEKIDSIDERLERLERYVKRLKRLTTCKGSDILQKKYGPYERMENK